MPSHPEAVVICLRATTRQITTIFIRQPTKKRSRNATPLQPGNFRPFPIRSHLTFGRKMPRCHSLANRDHSHMPPSYKMVGNCRATIAWHFPTIPAHLHANKRSKYTALPQSSASRQNAKWKRPPSRSAIDARPQIRPLAPIEVRRTLNTSVQRPKHHAAMSTPDKVFPAARQTHPAAE